MCACACVRVVSCVRAPAQQRRHVAEALLLEPGDLGLHVRLERVGEEGRVAREEAAEARHAEAAVVLDPRRDRLRVEPDCRELLEHSPDLQLRDRGEELDSGSHLPLDVDADEARVAREIPRDVAHAERLQDRNLQPQVTPHRAAQQVGRTPHRAAQVRDAERQQVVETGRERLRLGGEHRRVAAHHCRHRRVGHAQPLQECESGRQPPEGVGRKRRRGRDAVLLEQILERCCCGRRGGRRRTPAVRQSLSRRSSESDSQHTHTHTHLPPPTHLAGRGAARDRRGRDQGTPRRQRSAAGCQAGQGPRPNCKGPLQHPLAGQGQGVGRRRCLVALGRLLSTLRLRGGSKGGRQRGAELLSTGAGLRPSTS
mmetsp:Transcript_37216/g.117011  ORF Transcript_37216/g.117011 Transcript_37216/m.117011 type:complete len:369 (+) Transcript_37216:470-1576(+)